MRRVFLSVITGGDAIEMNRIEEIPGLNKYIEKKRTMVTINIPIVMNGWDYEDTAKNAEEKGLPIESYILRHVLLNDGPTE